MLDFNPGAFLVLLANFLILLFILNKLLFAPLSQVFKERENATIGALEQATSMTAKKDEAIQTLNAELLRAKNAAKAAHDALREEGQAAQRETLGTAEAQAVALIEQARKELQAESEKARAALKGDIEKFSEEIVRKLVKAA